MERPSPEQRQLLRDADQAYLGKPLDLIGNCVPAIHASTRHMATILRDDPMPDRATRAASYAAWLVDTSIAAGITEPRACAKGCSHCCVSLVTCTLPEVFRMARAVRGKATTETRIRAAAARHRAESAGCTDLPRAICPILENDACSEYEERPAICRVVMSTSLPRCLDILRDGRGGDFAYPAGAQTLRTYASVMLRAALIVVGLPHQNYEISNALEVVLSTDNAEARWLAGEPIFAHVPVDRVENKRTAAVVQLSEGLAAAITGTM